MHIVLGVLTSLITILYLLDRMGVDLGGLNPFYWRRRRAWAKKYEGDPIYAVEDPIEVAALLVLGAARVEGDLSAEQKHAAQEQFESEFSMDARDASQLLSSAAHLLGAPQVIDTQLEGVAEKNKGRFSREQSESMLRMMVRVASTDGELTQRQREYIDFIKARFAVQEKREGAWAQ